MDVSDTPRGRAQSLLSEEHVAERIRLEREARGWSTATLAERMTEAGFTINQSAIWRIESAEPRRRINLDEAIGFAEIFSVPLDNLLGPPRLAMHARAKELIEEVRVRYREVWRASAAAAQAREALDAYIAAHPEIRDEVETAVNQAIAEDIPHPLPLPDPAHPKGGGVDSEAVE